MNYPATSCGVSKAHHANVPIPSPRNFLVRGPDPDWPGFPFKTCGNDGLGLAVAKTQQAAGNQPQAIEEFELEGQWLFRWRSYLPLVMVAVMFGGLEYFDYPYGSHLLDQFGNLAHPVDPFHHCLMRTNQKTPD